MIRRNNKKRANANENLENVQINRNKLVINLLKQEISEAMKVKRLTDDDWFNREACKEGVKKRWKS
jgi:hypothetical protein